MKTMSAEDVIQWLELNPQYRIDHQATSVWGAHWSLRMWEKSARNRFKSLRAAVEFFANNPLPEWEQNNQPREPRAE